MGYSGGGRLIGPSHSPPSRTPYAGFGGPRAGSGTPRTGFRTPHTGMGAPPHTGFGGQHNGDRSRHRGRDRFHHDRMPYMRGYPLQNWNGAYNGAYLGWPPVLNPWLWGSSGSDDYDNSGQYGSSNPNSVPYVDNQNAPGQYANDGPGDNEAAPDVQAPQPRRSTYAPWTEPVQSAAATAHDTPVTLIFKDGRPPEQIHNYLLTSNQLTVMDERYREIPLEQINMAATEAVNRSAGIDFHVPHGLR